MASPSEEKVAKDVDGRGLAVTGHSADEDGVSYDEVFGDVNGDGPNYRGVGCQH